MRRVVHFVELELLMLGGALGDEADVIEADDVDCGLAVGADPGGYSEVEFFFHRSIILRKPQLNRPSL